MLTTKKIGKKIKEIRESFGLSQAELAKKMGFSRTTITHIEAGKRDLGTLELIKLAAIFNIDPGYFFRDEEPAKGIAKKHISASRIRFNKEKLKNVILYILEKCGGKPNLGETVLYKLLYFIDFDSYEIYGKPITGMNYVKLQFGPVPKAKEYNPTVELMVKNNELKIITQDYYGMIQKRYIALKESDKAKLCEQEKNIINEIILKYSDMNAKSIEYFVHGDAPWQITEEMDIINYNLVFERVAPYAHFDYEKMWRDTAAFDTLKELGKISADEVNYYKNL
ncbi:DUF4065 domain-containing protein [Candidatus Parcubacteria bacterium]|nr:DUF4065 domain-containing protein [Candidatus Parcubacteria bacterium]